MTTPFLTFLIITYRRPEKVSRLLEGFLDDLWSELDLGLYEIVVADDHSEDNTGDIIQPIISKLRAKGWSVRYVYREENLRGDRNLYYGYSRDSLGMFVWFLCDDDQLYPKEAIKFINNVKNTEPLIAICGFEQGDRNQYGNKFNGDVRLIDDYVESIDCLVKFPKTTAYLMRRRPDLNLDTLFEKLDLTLFSWIGLAVYILGSEKDEKLLIHPSIVACADEDYSLLSYSYRVFGNLYTTIKLSLEFADYNPAGILPEISNLKSDDELTLNLTGLQAHYSIKSHTIYTDIILRAELRYLRDNWIFIWRRRIRVLALLKLFYRRLESYLKK